MLELVLGARVHRTMRRVNNVGTALVEVRRPEVRPWVRRAVYDVLALYNTLRRCAAPNASHVPIFKKMRTRAKF